MIFNFLLDKEIVVKKFCLESQKRFNDDRINKVFVSDQKICLCLSNENRVMVSVSRTIGIPPVYLMGLIGVLISLFFWGFGWGLLFPAGFFCFGFFWSSTFHSWAFKKGLRKAGYEGEFVELSNEKALEVSLYESDRFIKLV